MKVEKDILYGNGMMVVGGMSQTAVALTLDYTVMQYAQRLDKITLLEYRVSDLVLQLKTHSVVFPPKCNSPAEFDHKSSELSSRRLNHFAEYFCLFRI